MLELKCVYMRPTPTHTHTQPCCCPPSHTHTGKLRRRWLRCRRRFRRLAMTRGGQSRQWRQFHAKRTLINLLHTRVAPPSPVPDTCCAPVCVYVCVWVCECECVGAIIICVLRAPLTVRTRSCCCCLISAPGQSAQHSQKTQHDSREKLH